MKPGQSDVKIKSGRADINFIKEVLSDRKQFMIRMFDAGCSLREIGRVFSISPMRVRQIIGSREVDKLANRELVDDILDDYKNDGATPGEIDEIYGLHPGTANRIINKSLSSDERREMKRLRQVNRIRRFFAGFVYYLGERKVCSPNDLLRYDRALYALVYRMRNEERGELFREFGIELRPLRNRKDVMTTCE